jgi:hypothetical protein
MTPNALVLVPCQHANSTTRTAMGCPTCYGSGYVRVTPGSDGEPKPCQHANSTSKSALGCPACYGSGWAGLWVSKG